MSMFFSIFAVVLMFVCLALRIGYLIGKVFDKPRLSESFARNEQLYADRNADCTANRPHGYRSA